MGLLDSLLNQTYGDNGGGLLGYLQSPLYRKPDAEAFPAPSQPLTPTEQQLMNMVRGGGQGGYVPGSGQPSPVPQDAPLTPTEQKLMALVRPGQAGQAAPAPQASPQPPQASPLAIGNYMMPRIGAASAYEPQQSDIPPNARPTQGQMPQAPAQQPMDAPQQLPPALGGQPGGFLGQLSEGLRSIGNGGSLLGALTGNRNDPQSIAQQNLSAQFQSLRQTLQQSGMSPQEAASKAMLAIMNPEAGKTIISEALTNKEKYGVISEDPLEGKRYGFINERDQTVNGKPLGQQGTATAGGGGMAALQAAQNAGVTGEALYDHLPTQMRGVVKAMIEGRQPLPSTTSMRNPATLALIDAAHAIDPTFDATTWKARQSGQVDFTSGKSAEMVRSANQTLHHVGQLLDSMDNLNNGSYPLINRVGNAMSEARGSGAQGAFRTNAHAVAEELSKVFKGSNLSDSEIRSWEQNLHENMSPEQQHTQILKLKDLLQGSLHALEEKRVSSIGPMAADKAGPIIKEEGQKVLERIDQWASGNKASTSAPAAIPPGWTVKVR